MQGGRVSAAEALRAVSRGSDARARPSRRHDPRAQASRGRRHLHHRPQRQLHEHLRCALQLLRVLSPRGIGVKATSWASRRSSARSTRRSAVGGNQLLLQGGHNPDLPIQWYEDLFRAVKARYPEFKLHALSPPEVLHISRLNQIADADGHRAAGRCRSRQHSGRRRRDPRRSRAQAAELLQQGDVGRVARHHAPGAPRRPAHHGDDDVRHGGDATKSASST